MTETIHVIKKRKDFIKVAQKGQKVIQSSLILQAAFNFGNLKHDFEIGYTATKKLGKAHIRNRTKRRLRAIARELLPQNHLSQVQYVLIGRHNTASCDFDKIRTDMQYALKKIHKLLQKEDTSHEKDSEKNTNFTN